MIKHEAGQILVVDYFSLDAPNTIKQVDFEIELFEMNQDWKDVKFIAVCVDTNRDTNSIKSFIE